MKTVNLLWVVFFVFAISGCKKFETGVLEIRKYIDASYVRSTGSILGFHETFSCIVIDGDLIDFNEGEVKTYDINGPGEFSEGGYYTHVAYIYHEDKTAKDLGYTQKMNGEVRTHYGTSDTYFYTEESGGIGLPAVNSGFGQIAGAWKFPATGEVVWIDSDRNGTGKLIHGGSKFPEEALGGTFFTEVRKTGKYTYEAKNHSYFPGSGWMPASYLDFELSKDGKTFQLGSATWVRIN